MPTVCRSGSRRMAEEQTGTSKMSEHGGEKVQPGHRPGVGGRALRLAELEERETQFLREMSSLDGMGER